MPFDVELTMPRKNYTNKAKRAIKSVNLMCFLLEDVTYNQLYACDARPAISKMVAQAEKINAPGNDALLNKGAYTDTYNIQPNLLAALRDIKTEIFGPDEVVLGNLFTTIYPDISTPYGRILALLDSLYKSQLDPSRNFSEFDHFCCPFRYFQQSGTPLDPSKLADLLAALGDKRMIDLYTEKKRSYSPAQIQGLRRARDRNIIKDTSRRVSLADNYKMMNNPWANGLVCDNGVCITGQENDWCNDASGSCSAASNP